MFSNQCLAVVGEVMSVTTTSASCSTDTNVCRLDCSGYLDASNGSADKTERVLGHRKHVSHAPAFVTNAMTSQKRIRIIFFVAILQTNTLRGTLITY